MVELETKLFVLAQELGECPAAEILAHTATAIHHGFATELAQAAGAIVAKHRDATVDGDDAERVYAHAVVDFNLPDNDQ